MELLISAQITAANIFGLGWAIGARAWGPAALLLLCVVACVVWEVVLWTTDD